jgi:ATP-dependent helicase/nuclease subunit B
MAVQFILGRSGTGKTSYCIKAIVDALLEPDSNQPLILLVPEQATYQAERAILADERIAGYNRLNVLSFDRLQFLLLGKNTARPALSRIGQQMLIHRILRDNRDTLKLFGSSTSWPGLGRQIAQTVIELHQYAKTPHDIEELLGKLQKDERNSLSALKFADIGLILAEYLKFIEGRFVDPDVQLNQACRAVAAGSFAKGVKLWVDGFAGFTASELAVLAELLKAVEEAQIALCLDPTGIDLANPDVEKLDSVGLFSPTEQTYAAIMEIVKKCKLSLGKPIILQKAVRFSDSPQLAHVERNIFRPEAPKLPTTDNMRVVSAPNARAEVRFVARQILQLVKEKDCRYRDIAVIASDLDRYQHYIKAYFDDYGVPFFIDKRKPLNQHPVVQLICSALQAVTGGFSSSDIFTYLKTDLVPTERSEVDLLENYCLAYGVTADDWQSDRKWQFAGEDEQDFDEQHINEIRLKAIGPLLELRDRLCPADNPAKPVSAEKFTQIVFDFLNGLRIREKLSSWIEEAAARKDYTAIDEHRQFYDKLLNIFDELVEIFVGQEMNCQDYLAIINAAFSQLTLAFIPPALDQVLVGSIERSRHPDLKAVFLIGATQKQFPVPVSFDSILSEDDRSAAESADFPLAAKASEKLTERQYLTYIAFTRPSQLLCVTYPLLDEKGSAVIRSQFITELESLFENLGEESIAGEQVAVEEVHTETELSDLLCSRLGKDTSGDSSFVTRGSLRASGEQLGRLLDDICTDEKLASLGSIVAAAIHYDNRAQLDKDVVEEFFGQRITSSATKLNTFAACPYQHFARYMLELEERKEFKFEPLDLGLFYHRVLDALSKRLNEEGNDFAAVRKEELLQLLREQTSKIIQTSSFISNFMCHSQHNAFIINSTAEVLENCVLAIAEMVRAGSFRPRLSEVTFGEVKHVLETLGEYALDISDKHRLFLDGKIDRLDFAHIDDRKVAIVFDYKLNERRTRFNWSMFFYGLNMQLPIYLLAVMNAKESKTKEAVGAFFVPIEVPPKPLMLDRLSEKADSFNYKAKGVFDGEFSQLLDRAEKSGWSKFYSFCVSSKDHQYGDYGKSAALRPEDFEKVLKFTRRKIVQLAQEILSGKIDVRPYRLSGRSPCGYCKYKSVCRFDWQINDYNFLESLNKLQVLEKMGALDG